MKKKLLQTCVFMALFGLLLIVPIGRVSADTVWNLQVSNTSNDTVNYGYDQLLTMPETAVTAGEYCYGYPVTSGDWTGVSLSYLLQQAGLDSTVASVNFLATDGYTVSLQIQDALRSDVIIAYRLNDVPLPETLRLVIPDANGNMWIAMIISISMSTSTTQPGIAGGPGIAIPNYPIQQNLTQQDPVQTQQTAPKNATSEPTTPPTNITQPAQKVTAQLGSNPGGLGFPFAVIYGVVIGAILAVIVATITIIRRRKIRATSLSSQSVLSN